MEYRKQTIATGFTIVELLIVIVVIGILATVTIVAYNGIQTRAVAAALSSDVTNAARQLKLFQIDNGTYPTTIDCGQADSITNKCLKSSLDVSYQYIVDNTGARSYCLAAVKGLNSYNISQTGAPLGGNCPVMHLDAGNTTSYPGTGTTWADISLNNNNGILNNGVAYSSENGGVLSFDGVNDYVSVASHSSLSPQSITVSGWIKLIDTSSWMIVNKGSSGTAGAYYLYGDSSSTARWSVFGAAGQRYDVQFTGMATGQWYYLAATFDDASRDSKIYQNGALKGTRAGAALGSNAVDVIIGAYVGGSGYQVGGLISDINIYSKALTETEINHNFNTLRGRYGI